MAATSISYSTGNAGLKKQVLYGKERIVTVAVGATGDTSYTIKLHDRLIMCTALAGTEFTLTLPNVVEAMGLIFSVYHDATAGTINLQDNDESTDFNGDYELDASADNITLYSNGVRWVELDNAIA